MKTLKQIKPRQKGKSFANPFTGRKHSYIDVFKWGVIERLKGKKPDRPEKYDFHYGDPDYEAMEKKGENGLTATWIGHNTVHLNINGTTVLTDPIWSKRASPVTFAGPKRQSRPGVPLENIKPVDIVIVSHNHYDHMDLRTLKRMENGTTFMVPKGNKRHLDGKVKGDVIEMNWGDSAIIEGTKITCTPAKHFSQRVFSSRNRDLWATFVLEKGDKKVFFGGDTGFFKEMKLIGDELGPFDLSLLPIGAYLPAWFMERVHMGPKDALKASKLLRSKNVMAIHWGTFDLADDPLDLAPRKLLEHAENENNGGVKVWVPDFGETRSYKIQTSI